MATPCFRSLHEAIAQLNVERADSLRAYCVQQAYRHALRAMDGHAKAVFRAEYGALRRIWSVATPEDDQGLNGAN